MARLLVPGTTLLLREVFSLAFHHREKVSEAKNLPELFIDVVEVHVVLEVVSRDFVGEDSSNPRVCQCLVNSVSERRLRVA